MWYLVAGLLLGLLLGFHMPWKVPALLARYLAVSLLAGVDTALGGLRASLEGEFSTVTFVSGFLGNAILSAVFVYVGDVLGIELYLAAVVALGVRIFNNLGRIRRYLVEGLTSDRSRGQRDTSEDSR